MRRPGPSKGSSVVSADAEGIVRAAARVRGGGIVAFPTETSYGLGVDPFNEAALRHLFAIKKRPPIKPILLIIDHPSRLPDIVSAVPDCYLDLMERFWPGPLTLIFPARKGLSRWLTGGTATVGVRVSSAPVATELCRRVDGPITATSANISGRDPAYSAEEVMAQFPDGLDLILDGGSSGAGQPSTVVGQQDGTLRLLRQGCLAFTLLQPRPE